MSTPSLTTAETTTAFDTTLVALACELDRQSLISQNRCVDHLLDLYNSASTAVIRHLVAEIVGEIRHLRVVDSERLQGQLDELSAAASVEGAFFG